MFNDRHRSGPQRRADDSLNNEASASAMEVVHTLKEAFWQADQAAIRNEGMLPQHMAAELCEAFLALINRVNDILGDHADIDPDRRQHLAAYCAASWCRSSA